jgi:hypothetical protein
VGGVPSSALPQDLRATIKHRGAIRRVVGEKLKQALALPIEQLDAWADSPPNDLRSWATEVLSRSKLEKYDELSEEQRLKVYAPREAFPRSTQLRRWRDVDRKIVDGRYLARREWLLGGQVHRVVEVKDARITRAGVPALGAGDVRRLCYGLDLIARNPTVVECSEDARKFTVVLRSEIPSPEHRLFAALGALTVPSEGYYPRHWTFELRDRPLIAGRLDALGVEIAAPKHR